MPSFKSSRKACRRVPTKAGVFTAALTVALMAPELAPAQSNDAKGPGGSDWRFMLGAGGGYVPDYEGSDDYDLVPLPLAQVSWRDTVSIGTVGGPGVKVKFLKIKGPTPKDQLVFSAKAGYTFGRDEDANDALGGLGDMDGGATLKIAADYQYQNLGASLSLGRDLTGDREGMTLNAGLNYGFELGSPKTVLTLGTSLTWADDNYMENTFGISAAQAASSALSYAAYEAGSGIKDIGVSASMRHMITRNIALTGTAGYKQLLSDAADSPIVDAQGRTGQVSVLVGVSYNW